MLEEAGEYCSVLLGVTTRTSPFTQPFSSNNFRLQRPLCLRAVGVAAFLLNLESAAATICA